MLRSRGDAISAGLPHDARMGKDGPVDHDAASPAGSASTARTTWSVPGSQAEPDAVAPLDAPPGPRDAPVAAPGGVADGRRPAFAAAGPLAEPAGEQDGAAVPTLRLQPMTVADVLDGGFAIVKARPARILGLAAIFVVPVHLLAAYIQRNAASSGLYWDAFTSDDPAVVADATQNSSGGDQIWASILVWFLPAYALVFVAAGIAHMVAAWSAGRDVPAGALFGVMVRRWWPLTASFVVIHVLEVLGCYIGTLFVMAVFVVTAPVIGAEGLGPMKAMSRAANLAMRRFWPTLLISVAIGVVSLLLSTALGGLPLMIAYFLDFDLAWPVQAAGGIVGAVISTPFVAAATVLLYLDLRVRTEGLDIELAAIDLANDAR
jgi:hypothetical protein